MSIGGGHLPHQPQDGERSTGKPGRLERTLPQGRDAAGGAGGLPAGQGDGLQLHPGCGHYRLYGERGNLDH